jgi:hypothetical protein
LDIRREQPPVAAGAATSENASVSRRRSFFGALRRLDAHRRAEDRPHGVAHLGFFVRHAYRDGWIDLGATPLRMIALTHVDGVRSAPAHEASDRRFLRL